MGYATYRPAALSCPVLSAYTAAAKAKLVSRAMPTAQPRTPRRGQR
jgi:hypothetical protein